MYVLFQLQWVILYHFSFKMFKIFSKECLEKLLNYEKLLLTLKSRVFFLSGTNNLMLNVNGNVIPTTCFALTLDLKMAIGRHYTKWLF